MEKGYKSIEEIIREVAEEEGLNFRETRDIWNHQKHYVKKLMETDGIYAIFLPYIGTLSLNVKQFQKEIKTKITDLYKGLVSKIEKLVKHENYSQYSNAHKRITSSNKLARRIISAYDTGHERSKRLLLHKKCWEIIERYSNGQYNKRETKLTRQKNESTKADS